MGNPSLTAADLDRRARSIAVHLLDLDLGGHPVCLFLPPGRLFIEAFFGCLYAGAIAVPLYPPTSKSRLARTQGVIANSGASHALTSAKMRSRLTDLMSKVDLGFQLDLHAADTLPEGADHWVRPADLDHEDSIAFVQYTSGSTGTPKGVMVGHDNLMANLAVIQQAFQTREEDVAVNWLPQYHDMGLIGTILQAVYAGFSSVLMPPIAFIRDPLGWLELIDRYRGTLCGGPNFAYEHCLRALDTTRIQNLDLSCWRVAFNGAEPIRADTLSHFSEAFGEVGFRRDAFFPCYGMAESTLFISGGSLADGPMVHAFARTGLERGASIVDSHDSVSLVSCGRPVLDQRFLVVDPERLSLCEPGKIGEIWTSGRSVGRGYWQRPEESARVFEAHLDDGRGPFLRTGDLGFLHEGELFVTGRLKDLIIIRGLNHYPQDIEASVGACHPALARGAAAAFSVTIEDEERLVVAQEVRRDHLSNLNQDEVIQAIRRAVAEGHELVVHAVLLLRPASIPKTSSGKIRRNACREGYLDGSLATVADDVMPLSEAEVAFELDRDALLNTPKHLRADLLVSFLSSLAGSILRIPGPLDPSRHLTAMGLDSMMAVSLQHRIDAAFGVALPITVFLEDGCVAALANLILARLEEAPVPLATPVDERGDFPLSFNQLSMWYLQELAPDNASNHISFAVKIGGALDADRVRQAFDLLLTRHDALRSTFHMYAQDPVQRVQPLPAHYFKLVDAGGWDEARLQDYLTEETIQPFDLRRGPLLRLRLLRLDDQTHVLAMVVHHIAVDFWSIQLMMDAFGRLYQPLLRGETPFVTAPSATYRDFVFRQRDDLAGTKGEAQRAFWSERLEGVPTVLGLPTDFARPPVQTYRGAAVRFALPAASVTGLRRLANEADCTLYTAFLTVFQALLFRYTGQVDFLVGSPTAGRDSARWEDLVGYFANPVALRADLKGNPSFRALLPRSRATVLGALAHANFPYQQLVELIAPERDPSRPALFQVMFALQKPSRLENSGDFILQRPGARIRLGGLEMETMALRHQVAQFDLTLTIVDTGDEGRDLEAMFEFNSDLFSATRVGHMADHFKALSAALVEAPDKAITLLPLLSDAERRDLLLDWNDTTAAYPKALCLHQLLELRAADAPDSPAVISGGVSLSYRELDRLATSMAARLQRLGVGPEVPVGIHAHRSTTMLAGIFAIFKAGGAYVPLDPVYPKDRLAFMFSDSGMPVVLVEPALVADLPEHSIEVLCLDDEADQDDFAAFSPVAVSSENLAYLIYTSGSTGKPKGVGILHRCVNNLIHSMAESYALRSDDVLVGVASISFDLSVLGLYLPLVVGACQVLATEEELHDGERLASLLDASNCTVMEATPSTWRMLVNSGWQGRPEMRIHAGGEAFPTDLARQLRPLGSSLINLYGPTEATVWCSVLDIDERLDRNAPVPVTIGPPIANSEIYILDPFMNPVPAGIPGELFIGGHGLARCYYRRPALTAEKFVPNPFSFVAGERLYRTGDLLRRLGDGTLEFMSRMDFQVKLRGYRIELGEIEAALDQHPSIAQAVAVVCEAQPGTSVLAAYVALTDRSLEEGALKAALATHLKAGLPEYMVPSVFVLMDALPLSGNGKVDRKALPAIDFSDTTAYVAPRSEIEERLVQIWGEVLGVSRLGVEDSFFRLGGHSLSATQLLFKVKQAFGIAVSLNDFYDAPSVAGLAAILEGRHIVSEDDLPQITPDPDSRFDPFDLTDIQQAYWMGRTDSFELGNVSTHVYVETESSVVDITRLQDAFRQLILRHDMMRAIITDAGRQVVLPEVPAYVIEVTDLRDEPEAVREQRLLEIRDALSHKVLPADTWPLFEVCATRLPDRFRLHLSFDALITDGWSLRLLARELAEHYAHPERNLPTPRLSFRDCVVSERSLERSVLYQRARAYWTDRLDSLPAAPDLPLACQPESITKPHFKRRHLCIPPRQWQRLQARAAGHGLTSSGLLLAAFSEVLAAWSKSPHFCLNLTLFSRPAIHPQIHEVVGDFTTLLLLAFDGAAGGSFLDRATALQEQLWRDMDHRFYGGVRVLRDLSRSQKSGGRATMPIVFTSLLGLDEAADRADASPLGDEVFAITQTPQVWLDHQVMERDGYLESNWDAIDALFPAGMLDDMFLVFRRLLSELADASEPWNRLGRPSLPDDLLAERRIANATEAPVAEVLLHELFLAQLQSRPEAQAVLSESRALTYAELYDWAEATAAELRRLGVRPNSLVAVSMVKGWEQVVAVMAILLAGAAYLPVDPSQPWDRRRRILEDGKVSLALVCDDQLAFPWPDGVSPMTLIEPSGSMPRSSASLQQPHDLAYVIFTSGSTGRPKGVAISHLAAANTLLDINRRFEVGPQDRVFALSSLSFDLSVFDVFGLLAAGGAMVLPNPDLSREPAHWVDLMSRFDVSIWNTVPALMQMLVEFLSGATSVPPALRLVMMSGDWIPVSLPMRIEALWPEIEVFSLGGATEASIWSIFYPIEQSDPDWVSIPYGKPLTNQSFHVLDEFLDPKPTWVPGRLFIGGYGLASCYWGDPEKTGQRFIIHPKSGERLYDTGDLGRYLPDGNIEFLGREDFQVKINGFRIELGEIETALLQHPEVSEALVNAVGNRNRHLDAYVVAKEGATALFRAEIIEEADASSYWDAVTSAGIEQARQVHWDTDKATFAGLWQDLETLYDHAVCCAFRDLGAWLNDGDGYDVDQFIDLFGVAPRYRKWLLRAFKALEQRGWLLRRGDVFVSVSALPVISLSSTCDHVRHVLADVLGFDVDVSQQIIFPATHLAEILVEKIHSAEIYASDETPMIYQKLFSHGNVLVRETMAAIVAHLPADKPLRIIEVGAGIGSTTVHILPQLPAERCTYLFTDISRYFFGKVKQAFEPFSFVHYDLLDLEQPIEPQGYAPHSFDVVVASNVLHVPRRIDACMRHIRSLLAPGGFLVVIEETSFARWFDLGMGLQIGFERFEDHDLRPDHPLLSREGWLKAAADAGFQKGMVFYEPDTIPDMIGFDAWVAQAPSSVQHFDPSSLRDHLLQRVPDYMVPTNFGLLDALPLTANGKVDRSALPLLGGTERSVTSDSFEEAHTANQKRIADIFAEILGLDQVGINDSFFEIGGDSLLATQVVSRIRESFGHDLSLRTLFQEATVAALAKIIDEAEVGGSHANTQIPILERSGDLPLSFAQKRMWFMGQLDGQSAAYNVPFTLLFSGPLQVDTMAANLDEIVARHEVLRTTFPTVGKEPVQIVHDRANTELALVDLSDMANELQEEMVARLATAEAVNLFDLAAGPLLRVTLLRRDLDTHVVLVTMHHIVADGWSIGVLIKEVAALYRASVLGMPSPLPPLPIQYVDFAAWQRNHLSGQVLEEQLSYWREALADVPLLHSLPTDRPRPEVQKFLGKMVRFEIDAETTTGLKRLGRQADATLFMTLQAVFVMLLSRISGSEDIVLGSAIANRHIRETEPLIGFFVNNLVLRTDLREDPNFPVLLGRVRETSLAAYAHQDLPFEKLVEELSPKRNLSYNPLFQIKFVLENAPMGDLELPAVTVTPLPVENATAKIDLTLFLQEVDGRLTGIFEYDSDLFDASTITRWKDHYLALLQAVLTDPGKAISAYSLVSESEETALMGAFTDDLEDDF